MAGRRGEGRKIPSPVPDDVRDWTEALRGLKDLNPRSIAAHRDRTRPDVPGASSTWGRILNGTTLPSKDQLDVLVSYLGSVPRLASQHPPEKREHLKAAWRKASDCLSRASRAESSRPAPEAPAPEGPGTAQQPPPGSGRNRGREAVADFHAPWWGVRAVVKGPAWMILATVVVVAVTVAAVLLLGTDRNGPGNTRPGQESADGLSHGGAPPPAPAGSPTAGGPSRGPGPEPAVAPGPTGEQCRGPVQGYTPHTMVDVCYRRAGDDVYMIAYIQADRPASVDLYLWLKDGTGSTVLYPADKAVAWTGLAVRSTQVREETRIAVRLTKGAQYFVCFQDFPAGSPAPKIRNSTTGRQVGFTY